MFLTRVLSFRGGAFSAGPSFRIGRVGDEDIEGVRRDRSDQMKYVPVKGRDSFNKSIMLDILTEELKGMWFDFIGDETCSWEFSRK